MKSKANVAMSSNAPKPTVEQMQALQSSPSSPLFPTIFDANAKRWTSDNVRGALQKVEGRFIRYIIFDLGSRGKCPIQMIYEY